ncbi:hypothetical protein [Micromonospora sp. NBRC 110038]|uniref:hypothetical protein n=1 Tax=Micromonospora sp. NBRC 110038 TaxID=1550034 RepID=UPI001E398924|nr:hypothetical protein [Micromonospora sp. NBRC 110038]
MSSFEHALIRTQLGAAELCPLLGLELTWDDVGSVYLSRPASDGRPGIVGGKLYRKRYGYPLNDPEEESLIDGYDLVWDIGYSPRDKEMQLDEAQRLFREITSTGRWPAILLRGMDLPLACWDIRCGYREFPPGTPSDVDHRALWAPYRQPPRI